MSNASNISGKGDQLEYDIAPHETHAGILRMTCKGFLNVENAAEVTQKARAMALEQGDALLFDYCQVTLTAGMGEIYFYPRQQEFLATEPTRAVRTAILITENPELKKWQFYETTAQNTGLNVRLFVDDEEGALAWLLSK